MMDYVSIGIIFGSLIAMICIISCTCTIITALSLIMFYNMSNSVHETCFRSLGTVFSNSLCVCNRVDAHT